MRDDGLSPDDAAGDGICSDTYTDTTTGGYYYVLVEADGTYASQAYHRTAQQGDFTVATVLQGEGGQYVDLANTTVYSFTGVTTLTLRFDGQAIRASGLDGPYTVTEVLLLGDADLIKLEEADDVWVTSPYDHRQFGVWSARLYLPLILRNR